MGLALVWVPSAWISVQLMASGAFSYEAAVLLPLVAILGTFATAWLGAALLRTFERARLPKPTAWSAGATDGDVLTVKGRVRVCRSPVGDDSKVALAVRSASLVSAGRFVVVLADGRDVLVDDDDLVISSASARDRFTGSFEICEGDEVIVSGPAHVVDAAPSGYRVGSKVFAFDGRPAQPVRVILTARAAGAGGAAPVAPQSEARRRVRVSPLGFSAPEPDDEVDAAAASKHERHTRAA